MYVPTLLLLHKKTEGEGVAIITQWVGRTYYYKILQSLLIDQEQMKLLFLLSL